MKNDAIDALPGLTSLLIDVQADPACDARLDALAGRSGYSASHFHRRFSAVLGETPREHVHRVRLEQAAYRVAITNESLLGIALALGFSGPETFSRAFRRRFGMAPSRYRRAAQAGQRDRLERNLLFRSDGCRLGEVSFVALAPLRLAALRHVGSYAEIGLPPFGPDDRLWSSLADQAAAAGAAVEPTPVMICLDDPTVTPGPLQQSDICLPLLEGLLPPDGAMRIIEAARGRYATIRHIGPHSTLLQAYRALADGVRRSTQRFGASPPLQVLRSWSDDAEGSGNVTDIYFPVDRRG